MPDESIAATEPRPRSLTPEMKQRIGAELAAALVQGGHLDASQQQKAAADIAKVARGLYMDGYALATDLDRFCGWACNLEIANELDAFSSCVHAEIKAAQRAWAERNSIEPPYPAGTRITMPSGEGGVIDEIYKYGIAQYTIKMDGDPEAEKSHRRLVINFEDVHVLDAA